MSALDNETGFHSNLGLSPFFAKHHDPSRPVPSREIEVPLLNASREFRSLFQAFEKLALSLLPGIYNTTDTISNPTRMRDPPDPRGAGCSVTQHNVFENHTIQSVPSAPPTLQTRRSVLRDIILPFKSIRNPKMTWPCPEASIDTLCGKSRGIYYWEVRGPAKICFENMRQDITRTLEHSDMVPSALHILTFECYMMGKSPSAAAPRVMFSCRDLKSRAKATEVLRKSCLFKDYPGFDAGHWPEPPGEGSPQLTGANRHQRDLPIHHPVTELTQDLFVEPVFASLETHSTPAALRVCTTREPWDNRLLCTVGCVHYLYDTPMLVSVAHALDNFSECHSNELNPEDDLVVDFGGLEEYDDDDDGNLFSNVNKSENTTFDLQPLLYDPFKDIGNSDRQNNALATNDIRDRDHIQKHPSNQEIEAINSGLDSGRLSIVHKSKNSDYSLLYQDAFPSATYSNFPILDWGNILSEPLESADTKVEVTTGRSGRIQGNLYNNRVEMLLPGCKRFTRAYVVELDKQIQKGDSGSVVLDAQSKRIVGLLVATVPGSPISYIMPADDVLRDIESSQFNSTLGEPASFNDENLALDRNSITLRASHVTGMNRNEPSPDIFHQFRGVSENEKLASDQRPSQNVTSDLGPPSHHGGLKRSLDSTQFFVSKPSQSHLTAMTRY